jgi:hypothetical protein
MNGIYFQYGLEFKQFKISGGRTFLSDPGNMNGIYFQYGLEFKQFKISGGSDIPV